MPHSVIVGSGAALGAVARYFFSLALTTAGLAAAWPLLLINVVGSAAMGYFKPAPFWGTGFLGGFTSFATFAYLTPGIGGWPAVAYIAVTALGCVGAYLLGDASSPKARS